MLVRRSDCRITTTIHDTGFVKVPVRFPASAKEKKQGRASRTARRPFRIPGRSCDLFGGLFYVRGIVPSNGRAKQLSQGCNAELFFRSGAVSLDSFETQIQISG